MTTDKEIYSALNVVFRELFSDDAMVLSAETSAGDIEGWDSFNHMNIIVATEARFGIQLEFSEIENIRCVGDLVSLVMRKVGAT